MELLSEPCLLAFCDHCSFLRICDVKDQLQKLFRERFVVSECCAICSKELDIKCEAREILTAESPATEESTCTESVFNTDDRKNDCVSESNDNFKLVFKFKEDILTDGQTGEQMPEQNIGTRKTISQENVKGRTSRSRCKPSAKVVRRRSRRKKKVDPNYYPEVDIENDDSGDPDVEGETSNIDSEQSSKQGQTKSESAGNDYANDDQHDSQTSSSDKEISNTESGLEQMKAESENRSQNGASHQDVDNDKTQYLDPKILKLLAPNSDPERPFKCKFCPAESFERLRKFQEHMSSHPGVLDEPIKEPYECDLCSRRFSSRNAVLPHIKSHSRKNYQCTYSRCSFTFRNAKDLKNHLEIHTGNRSHKCYKCGKGFTSISYLRVHRRSHFSRRPYKCQHCEKAFSHSMVCKRHEQKHINAGKFKCDKCSFTCNTGYRLKKHQVKHEEREVFQCDRCKKEFKFEGMLNKHMRLNTCKAIPPNDDIDITELKKFLDGKVIDMMGKPRHPQKPFRCKYCSKLKEYQKLNPFLRHVRQAHPDVPQVAKPHVCDQCDKQYAKQKSLKAHLNVHTGERPYKCDYPDCGKAFRTIGTLNSHKMIHTGIKKHVCPICGARFITKAKLTKHENRVHLDSRPFNCRFCEKAFHTNDKRNMHELRLHTDLRPWICEVCGMSYKTKYELGLHNRTHTGEKPFVCELCGYSCTRPDYLKSHMKTHARNSAIEGTDDCV